MFFATALKDYVDQLNEHYVLLNDHFTVVTFLKSFFLYFFDSIKFVGFYILSCKWFTDFIELPCVFQMNYTAILEGNNILETNVAPSSFAFLEPKPLTDNLFGTGFLNSFFLALPISVPHLLTLRFFLINGLPAGMCAAAGTILGQLVFFTCVLFGLESFLIPFFSFEPLNYILGFIIIINVLYNLIHKPNMEVLNLSQKSLLFPLFGVNFLLAWAEQTSVFQYFGSLTINHFPTILQGANLEQSSVSKNIFLHFILPNSLYLSGLLLGSILWTALFGLGFMLLRNKISELFQIPFMFFNEKIHNLSLFFIFTFCLTSIPYYGMDYVISGPLGFMGQDKGLIAFQPKTTSTLFSTSLNNDSFFKSVSNPIAFDRSQYFQRLGPENTFAFEDTSFEPEHYWSNANLFRKTSEGKTKGREFLSTSKNNLTRNTTLKQNEADNFYQSFYPPLNEEKNKKALSQTQETMEILASKVFDSLAYQYYDLENRPEFPTKLVTRSHFRKKFFSNPVYKALVHLDMKGFLSGQPQAYNLTNIDESNLYKRHEILNRYLNSVQDYKYNKLSKDKKVSYAENVYNQQFKGSLDLVRHYFSISLTSKNLESVSSRNSTKIQKQGTSVDQKILKFDQPLYNTTVQKYSQLLHEELEMEFQLKKDPNQMEVLDSLNLTQQRLEEIDRLEEVDTTPFYVGWDSSLRKFLVKKAWTSGLPLGNEARSNDFEKRLSTKLPNYFSFQSWPLVIVEENRLSGKAIVPPYIPLSEEKAFKISNILGLPTLDEESKSKTKRVTDFLSLSEQPWPIYNWSRPWEPHINELAKQIDLGNTLPPQFGGFVWPGNLKPQNLLKKFSLSIESNEKGNNPS